MLDSEAASHHPIGFSSGALERRDYVTAIDWLISHQKTEALELSALRLDELKPLVCDLEHLPLSKFHCISFHAPSSFRKEDESNVLELLGLVKERGWNIIVHPDVIYHRERWRFLGQQLLIENMDRRKGVGRTAKELQSFFDDLPEARLCLDVAHARQLDTTLYLLWEMMLQFREKIAEIHISELDSHSRHRPMSSGAVNDYRKISRAFPKGIPVIIESILEKELETIREEEFALTRETLS